MSINIWAVLAAIVIGVMGFYALLSLVLPEVAGLLIVGGIGTSAGLVLAVVIHSIVDRIRS